MANDHTDLTPEEQARLDKVLAISQQVNARMPPVAPGYGSDAVAARSAAYSAIFNRAVDCVMGTE